MVLSRVLLVILFLVAFPAFAQQPVAQAPAVSGWKSVASGVGHICATDMQDQVWCWGRNTAGQMGEGSKTSHARPTAMKGGMTWKQVSGGDYHTCGITTAGALNCWGTNLYAALLGNNAAANESLTPAPVSTDITQWNQVSTGKSHSCAISAESRLYCWGSGASGRLGNRSEDSANIPVEVVQQRSPGWKQVSAGSDHTCAIRTDDELHCWGKNDRGQLGIGAGPGIPQGPVIMEPTEVFDSGAWKQVSAGYNRTCAIKTDGALLCWGANNYGSLGNGTVDGRNVPTAVTEDGPWQQVSVSPDGMHTCGVKVDGGLFCWGGNSMGAVGDDTLEDRVVPTAVAVEGPWLQVATGISYSCAIRGDRALYCWGFNPDQDSPYISIIKLNPNYTALSEPLMVPTEIKK